MNGGPPFAPDVVHEVATPEQAREAVRHEAAKKVDLIKFWVDDRNHTKPHMSPKVYAAIIDEAHKQHLKAIAHIFYLEDAKGVARAGVDGIAHPVRDKVVDDELLQLMKQHNVFQCSTMSPEAFQGRPIWMSCNSRRPCRRGYINYMKTFHRKVPRILPGLGIPECTVPRGYELTLVNIKKESDAGIRNCNRRRYRRGARMVPGVHGAS